jgi:hypothetical protein
MTTISQRLKCCSKGEHVALTKEDNMRTTDLSPKGSVLKSGIQEELKDKKVGEFGKLVCFFEMSDSRDLWKDLK